jgi:Ubiquitin-conjugating enzyme
VAGHSSSRSTSAPTIHTSPQKSNARKRHALSAVLDRHPSNPLISWASQIYHPNIDIQGNVCLNILREDWKPVLNLNAIMVGLQYLFLEPNPDDPLNKGRLTISDGAPVLRLPLCERDRCCRGSSKGPSGIHRSGEECHAREECSGQCTSEDRCLLFVCSYSLTRPIGGTVRPCAEVCVDAVVLPRLQCPISFASSSIYVSGRHSVPLLSIIA